MVLLDGKKYANELLEEFKDEISTNNYKIKFAIIWIGNDGASEIYVKNKINKCEYVGIEAILYHLNTDVTEEEVLLIIDKLNQDESVNGILIQSPVPEHIDIIKCFNKIAYQKDIDGFSKESIVSNYHNNHYHLSCTPKGIIKLLKHYNIDLEGKDVCIINRSNIIGKPLMLKLLQSNATVTICHSKTKDLKKHTLNADIVISAIGVPRFITSDMIKENSIVVDVGISRIDGKVVGDVDFENVKEKVSYISPVPNGVGPMTIAMVIDNLIDTVRKKNG